MGPWKQPDLSQTFFDQLHGRKTSFSCDEDTTITYPSTKPRRILKRHSIVSDCNNLEVQKFMSKLTNIRRRKRRADKSNINSISPGVIKKSKSYDDITAQIDECHELCMGSLRAYTPQADRRRKLEAKRSRILRSLFTEKKK